MELSANNTWASYECQLLGVAERLDAWMFLARELESGFVGRANWRALLHAANSLDSF
jgi:hypothetical protein